MCHTFKSKLVRFLAIVTLGVSFAGTSLSIGAQSFTTFDPPGSLNSEPLAISSAGAVVGLYASGAYSNQGFVRAPNGTFTTFNVPGGHAMYPWSINSAGVITGDF